jgi:predicted TIM-barrel fold metal-dependent hydrolase
MTEIVDAYCTPGTERETRFAPEDLLRQMDAAQIARALIAPEDREIAVHNRSGNARIRQLAHQYPERFWPTCTVNPWYGPQGAEELRRAVGEGARVLVLAPDLQGFCLGDEVADELLTVAAELPVTVYVHTGPHSHAAPTQLMLVAARHQQTRFILGHCGSTDYAHDMPVVLKLAPGNVWFELSLVRPGSAAAYVKQADRLRFLFGSAAPRNDPAFELAQLNAYLPIAEYPDVYGGNLRALLTEARP